MIESRRAAYAGYGTRELAVDGDGPRIVLLHGFGHPADCWRPVLARLRAANRSAVAVDLPGFGEAGRTLPGPRLPQLDGFVADLVRQQSISSPVILVGNSLGGLLAVRAASIHALPIAAAMPIDAAGYGWTPVARLATVGRLRGLAAVAGLPVAQAVRLPVIEAIGRHLMYGSPPTADQAMIDLLTGPFRDRTAGRELMSAAVAYVTEVGTRQRAGRIRCPVTVVHGRRDRIVSLAASQRLHQLIPGSTLVVLDSAGHCPHLDAPDDIAALALRLAAEGSGTTRTGETA